MAGYLVSILPVRVVAMGYVGILASGVCVVAVADSLAVTIAGCVTVGFVVAGITMLPAMQVRYTFGDAGFGRIFSFTTVFLYAGMGTGPWLAGALFDWTESYRIPMLCLATLGLVAVAVLAMASAAPIKRAVRINGS